jgi:anaerobic magnesium-protoporphyrin IX monomethyl ester cyclase
MDEYLLSHMSEAGCIKVFYGVESGSDSILHTISKSLGVSDATSVVRLTLKYIPIVTTSFVWGFPDESYEHFRSTLDLLMYFASLGAAPQINLALPYSHSDLYKQYADRIVFEADRSTQLAFYKNAPFGGLKKMIASRPDLFSVFYRFPSQGLEDKWSYLDEIGLSPHKLQDEFMSEV